MLEIAPHSQNRPALTNPANVYISGLSEKSRRIMKHALGVIVGLATGIDDLGAKDAWLLAERFPFERIDYHHAQAIKQKLIEAGYTPAGVNRHLSALRGVLKSAWLLELMDHERYMRTKEVKGVKYERLPAGRALSVGEIGALMKACNVRDSAIIALLYGCGLRRAEVVGLNLSDVDLSGEVGEIVVRGKGNKERMAYLSNGGMHALRDWIEQRGKEAGALFLPGKRGNGRKLGNRLTAQSIYSMLNRRGKEAGIADFSPHDLRRTFISTMIPLAGLSTTSKLAGHANIKTTVRYDLRLEETKRQASQLLHVPYGV